MMIDVILTKTKYYHLYSSNTSNMMITISERINKSFLFIIPPPFGGKYSSFKCFVRYNNLYKNNLQLIKKIPISWNYFFLINKNIHIPITLSSNIPTITIQSLILLPVIGTFISLLTSVSLTVR